MYYNETYFTTPFYKWDCFHTVCITVANTLQQLHITQISFNN